MNNTALSLQHSKIQQIEDCLGQFDFWLYSHSKWLTVPKIIGYLFGILILELIPSVFILLNDPSLVTTHPIVDEYCRVKLANRQTLLGVGYAAIYVICSVVLTVRMEKKYGRNKKNFIPNAEDFIIQVVPVNPRLYGVLPGMILWWYSLHKIIRIAKQYSREMNHQKETSLQNLLSSAVTPAEGGVANQDIPSLVSFLQDKHNMEEYRIFLSKEFAVQNILFYRDMVDFSSLRIESPR